LDADITKCFDQINHEYLIKKLDTLPEIKTQVNAWLKAGIMEDLQTSNNLNMVPLNTIGTPQGGVISPLLLNVALHGMENHMKEWICSKPSFNKSNSKRAKQQSLAIIRYADDFILIHKNRGIIEEAKEEIAQWLKDGPQLELSETKTSIKNSNEGFNFLGFSCITIRRGNRSRLKIYPSKDSQKRLNLKVRSIIQKNKAASSYNLILLLRPLIIGWSNYFKYSECSYIFKIQSNLMFQKLRAWCFRRDKRNSRSTVKEKYFPSGKSYYFDGTYHKDNWVLTGQIKDKNGILKENYLPYISWVNSKKWVKIKGDASPYDGNNVYWGQRTKNKGTFNSHEN
jgi:RNA-directed DNA polymerase